MACIQPLTLYKMTKLPVLKKEKKEEEANGEVAKPAFYRFTDCLENSLGSKLVLVSVFFCFGPVSSKKQPKGCGRCCSLIDRSWPVNQDRRSGRRPITV